MNKEYFIGDKVYCADETEIEDALCSEIKQLDEIEGIVVDADEVHSEKQYEIKWVNCKTRRPRMSYRSAWWSADELTTSKDTYLKKLLEIKENIEEADDYEQKI